ncbi:MAG TPA: hypothetical protein VGC27_10785, partial [Rhizomicrobium sp.]
DPNWIAPLLLERQIHFDRSRNPFFRHAKAAFWLAYRGEVPVGRITAQIDALHLERHHDATGHFGFIEGVDDPAVFEALFGAAEAWLRAEGMRRSVGPISFSMWDEPGLLVEGFDRPPNVLMGHALPYYQRQIAACGYSQVQDLLAYEYPVNQPFSENVQRIIAQAQRKRHFRFRPMRMDRKNFASEIELILDIMNDAWSENWGFVPMTRAEVDDMAALFKFVLRPDAVVIAEYDGEAAGFGMMLPNVNEMIKDLKGRLFPFGFAKLLWRLKVSPLRSGRMALMGVRRKWWSSPVGAIVALLIIQQAKISDFARDGVYAELSWILDSNERVKRVVALFGASVIKRYRIYEKALGGNSDVGGH